MDESTPGADQLSPTGDEHHTVDDSEGHAQAVQAADPAPDVATVPSQEVDLAAQAAAIAAAAASAAIAAAAKQHLEPAQQPESADAESPGDSAVTAASPPDTTTSHQPAEPDSSGPQAAHPAPPPHEREPADVGAGSTPAPAAAQPDGDVAPKAEGSEAKVGRPAATEVGSPVSSGQANLLSRPQFQRTADDAGIHPHPPPGARPPGSRTVSASGSRPPSRANSRLGTPGPPDPANRFNSVFDFTSERLMDHTWRQNNSKVDRDRNTQSAPTGLYATHKREQRPAWISELDTPSRWRTKLPRERLEEAALRLYSRPTTSQSARPPERPRTGRLVYTLRDGRFHAEMSEPLVLPPTQYIAKLQVQYNRSMAEHHALKKELFTKYAPKLTSKEIARVGLDKEIPVKTEEEYLADAEEAIRRAEEAEEQRKELVRAEQLKAYQRAQELKKEREAKSAQRTQDFMEKHAAWLKAEKEKREREREEQQVAMARDKAALRQFAVEYAEKRARAIKAQQDAAEQRRQARIEEDRKRQEEAEKREQERKAAVREWRVADLERRKQIEEAAAARGDSAFGKSIAAWEEQVRQRQKEEEERRRMQVLKDRHEIAAQTAAYKAQIDAKKKEREDELAAAISIRLQEDAAREKKRQDREAAIREAQRQYAIDERRRRAAMMEKIKDAAAQESPTHAMQNHTAKVK